MRPTAAANARRVVRALERFGYANGEFEKADFTKVPNFLSFSSNGAWIDLMMDLLGVRFAEAIADGLTVPVAGVPVRYIGLVALRLAKQAAGRPQDLRDLENLPVQSLPE